ncbi:uncharacterized protein LY89DRAFT_161570 [Mollisia scopiformis]|uniref:Uncharacterized protein n=1 Tax=Mollisia scopiformis TaxID=149040 RepID=A0A194XSC3_MOLSC|nr:uncharacterized protein LY89DRAFT_161570 [Mollisia scopiformis]KUJ22939.1 hypothetical protein LY89DRAFT_161570 [Mollisia scopiformis]
MAAAASTFNPGSSIAPLPTPFWFSSGTGGSAPASCQATIIDPAESSDTYCCNGLLIDITQPILGSLSAQQHPFYFDNLRCCSADPDVALGSVTSCSTGSAAMLATSVAVVTSSNSSGVQIGMASTSTSTSTILSTSDVTTTATAASSSTSGSGGRKLRAGKTIYLFTILSLVLALVP